MKKHISLFIFLILMLSHTFTAHSSETVSTVSEDAFLNGYEKVSLPFVDEDVYLVKENSRILYDNALSGDTITSSIADFDILFPEGSGNYISMKVFKSESEAYEIFRITPFSTMILSEGAKALGIEEATADINLTDDETGTFRCAYSRWNKIRLFFSSTNNKTGIWHSGVEKKYTIKDTRLHSFASGGAYRVSISLGYDSSLGADTGVYMKNAIEYTAYLNATTQAEREALADRTGKYKYRYSDGSDDFLYEIRFDKATNSGYAVITGLDPNKCTKEIEDPVCFDYSLPAYADGYPVKAIGASAFEGLTGMERFDIPSCITKVERKAFAGSSFDVIVFRGNATLSADSFATAKIGELVFLGDVRADANPFEAGTELADFGKSVRVTDKSYTGKTELRNAKYDTSFAYNNKKGSLSWEFGAHNGFVVQIPYDSSYINDYSTLDIRYYTEIPGQKINLLVNEYNTFTSTSDNNYYITNLVTGKGWNTFSVNLADVKKYWSVEAPEYLYVYFISGWGLSTGTKEEFESKAADAISGEKMYVDSMWLANESGKKAVADFAVGAEMYDHAAIGLSRGLMNTDVAFRGRQSSLAWTFSDTNGLVLKLPFDESFKQKYESLVIRYCAQISGQTFGIGINETDHWGSQAINKYLLKNAKTSGKWDEYRIDISEILSKWDEESEYLYIHFDSKWFGSTAVKAEDFDSSKKHAIIGEKLYIDSIWLENGEYVSNPDITPVSFECASGIKAIFASCEAQAELKKAVTGYGAFNSVWTDKKASKAYLTDKNDVTLIDAYFDENGNIVHLSETKVTGYQTDSDGHLWFDVDLTPDEKHTRKIYVWNSISGTKPYSPSVVIYP